MHRYFCGLYKFFLTGCIFILSICFSFGISNTSMAMPMPGMGGGGPMPSPSPSAGGGGGTMPSMPGLVGGDFHGGAATQGHGSPDVYGADTQGHGTPPPPPAPPPPSPPPQTSTPVAPGSSISGQPVAGSGGWYNESVTVTFTKGSADRHSVSGGGSSESSSISVTASSSGTHTFTHVTETDNYDSDGNLDNVSTITNTVEVKIDVTPPTGIPNVNMDESWTNSPRSFTVSGGVDNYSGISHLEYQIDGGGWTQGTGGIARSTSGTSYVRVRAVDNVGQRSAPSAAKRARVDMTAPRVSFFPNGGRFDGVHDITRVSVTDNYSGVDGNSLRYAWSASSSSEPSNWTSFSNGQTIRKTDSLGTFYLWVRALDNVGNVATVVSNSFYIDNKIVKINIKDVTNNGNNLRPAVGYYKESTTNVLKLDDIEIDSVGRIILRDDNTNEIAVREDFEQGLRLNVSADDEHIIELDSFKLLDGVPYLYTSSSSNTAFVELTYDLKQITPHNGHPTDLVVGYRRPNGIVTPNQTAVFITWITSRDKDAN